MESDPLQQLRDVHFPPDPAWWPPAPGWWILAILIIAVIVWIVYRILTEYQRRAPIRAAKQILNNMYAGYTAGELTATEYLHQGNELLKRLLVRAFGRREYARLSGENWLKELDKVSASENFTSGTGRVLGEARFAPEPDINVEELNTHLTNLLTKVRP